MISKKEVKHIAKLARLQLNEKEAAKMQRELSVILDYFSLLKELNSKTQKKKEKAKKDLIENVTREDLVKKQSTKTIEKLFTCAPKKEKGRIRVKAVFQ